MLLSYYYELKKKLESIENFSLDHFSISISDSKVIFFGTFYNIPLATKQIEAKEESYSYLRRGYVEIKISNDADNIELIFNKIKEEIDKFYQNKIEEVEKVIKRNEEHSKEALNQLEYIKKYWRN